MKEFDVAMRLSVVYTIKAHSKEEALQIADSYWNECIPETDIEEVKTE